MKSTRRSVNRNCSKQPPWPACLPSRCLEIGIVDQEASFQLVQLTNALIQIFTHLDPDIVLTHAYEGGHPDHDAVAFAVNHARRFLARRSTRIPAAIEFACYHRNPDGENMETASFLPVPGIEPIVVPLSEAQQARKQQMFSCYISQHEILAQFPLHVEAFRIAPPYDFTLPPHPGPLFYEGFDWGMTGIQWRKLATRAAGATGSMIVYASRKQRAKYCSGVATFA